MEINTRFPFLGSTPTCIFVCWKYGNLCAFSFLKFTISCTFVCCNVVKVWKLTRVFRFLVYIDVYFCKIKWKVEVWKV